MSPRVLRVLDSAYDTDADDSTWLRRIGETAAPLLDGGVGVHAVLADLSRARPLYDPVLVGGEPAWQACWREHWWKELMDRAPADAQRAMLRFGAVSHTTRHVIEVCGMTAVGTPSECLAGVNGNRSTLRAECVSLYDAELDCLAGAMCSDSMPASCAAAHTATSDCAAAADMGI